MATFEVTRDGDTVEDAVYDVDPVVDTSNPFGNFAVIKIDDRGGTKFAKYGRGTRVDVDIDSESIADLTIASGETVTTTDGTTDTYGGTVQNSGTYVAGGTVTNQDTTVEKFTGYVVERRENEQAGADALEVEAYSFDQFLRRNTVTNDQQGNTISEALADIIDVDTPVTYVAGNVDVGDDQELTRGYQGEKVENALRDLAFKSNNEEFGVNDSLEFFFRPREATHIDRGIDNTQWFNYDIPELGKQAINEVEVWFNDGDESVVVDDGTDKLDLQDNLGLPEPGTQRAELNRPELTDIGDAEDVGRKYLEFRNATLSGTVTTFGLYDAQPGDTIDITIDPRGIDTEFVIAGVEYRWGRDETVLTIIEKRGDVDGILSELNESVQRQEMADANRDAPSNRITTTNATAIVDVTVDADGNTPTGTRFVNDGRRAVRDGWADKGNVAISNLVVGSDGTALSRSNTALGNQTNSAAVSESLPDAKSVEYTATITQTGVEEVGLETSGGTLITRAVFDSPVDLDGTVTVTLDVSNDDSVSRGVLTNDGQTAVRDVLADNTPVVPTDYAYGSDGTPVAETDTALGNELVSTSLTEVLIQDADTTDGWDSITPPFAADEPLTVDAGELRTQRITEFNEGEPAGTDADSNWTGVSDGDYSSSAGGSPFAVESGFARWEITIPYDIPADEVGIAVRDEIINASSAIDQANNSWTFAGNEIESVTIGNGGNKSLGWIYLSDGGFYSGSGYGGGDLNGGETYQLEFAWNDSVGGGITDYYVDCVAVYDQRHIRNDGSFDNAVDANNTLADPVLFPELVTVSLSTATTRRDVTEARFASTWTDTSNEQFVELANDGSTFTRFNNSDSGSVTFGSPESGVDATLGISHYATDTTTTPREGDTGQAVDAWSLFANPDAVVADDIGTALTRGVIPPNTITGETIREAGLKNGSTLLTRHQLADATILQDQRLASAESTLFTGDE